MRGFWFGTGGMADKEVDLSIDSDLYQDILSIFQRIELMSMVKPLAAIKLCLKLEAAIRATEERAAKRANRDHKISWSKIGLAMDKSATWAYDRYHMDKLRESHAARRKRLSKPVKPEMEDKPDSDEGENSEE